MRSMLTLTKAMGRGFLRDGQALFFALLFPVMFLVFFGTIMADPSSSRSSLEVIGTVDLLDELSPDGREAFERLFSVTDRADRTVALERVRDGDVDAALEQDGDRIVLHFSQADPTRAATVRGIVAGLVDATNIEQSGRPPTYRFVAEQVEDESLAAIQYIAPGLLGWAVAMSATFGAALTLVTWRQSELLRRLRLMPVTGAAIVGARLIVSLLTALAQTVVFLLLATTVFDLRLTGSWWAAIPLVLAGTTSFMAIGMVCGAFAKTNDGATGLANLIVLPMAFLSGSFIPLAFAPGWIGVVSRVLPLRYLNEGMLDVMVRGRGPDAILLPLAVLIVFTAVVGAIGSRSIRWDRT